MPTIHTPRMVETFNSLPISRAAKERAMEWADFVISNNSRDYLMEYAALNRCIWLTLAVDYMGDISRHCTNSQEYAYTIRSAKACVAIHHAVMTRSR